MAGPIVAGNGLEQETAIVADIQRAVRSYRQTVRAAADLRHHLDRAVGPDPAHGLALDLDQQDGAVGLGHRSFRELEPAGDDADIRHAASP
jgi:hypothetical protein